jgi:hypothetical protein
VPSKRKFIVLGCFYAHEAASAIFTTTPLHFGDYRQPQNLAFRLKSEHGRAAVADDPPNAGTTGAPVNDEHALSIALSTSTNADIGHGKFAVFDGASS